MQGVRMSKRVFVAVLALILSSCTSGIQTVSAIQSKQDGITKSDMELEAMSDNGFIGSVIAACNERIILNKHYGFSIKTNKIVRYEVASITKFLTSIALLRLVEDGQLKLTDKLLKFFPDVPQSHSKITIFQLLTHQSGIEQNYAAEGHAEKTNAANAIFSKPLKAQPAESFQYSNDNFSLLAMIIENVAGQSYRSYLDEVISSPLGMSPIGFWPDSPKAEEYLPPLLNPFPTSTDTVDWGFLGGHGARLSVNEIFKIVMSVENGKLLTPDSVATLQRTHVLTASGTGIGMGWYNRTDKDGQSLSYTSGSDQSGGNALAYKIDQNGLLVIAATNGGPAEKDGPGWSRKARDILIRNLSKRSLNGDICEKGYVDSP